jgi:hypothetical protein
VYKLHYGNNETLVTVNYCNDFDDKLGFAFTIYQAILSTSFSSDLEPILRP